MMASYFLKRLLQAVVVMFVVVAIAFSMSTFLGDPMVSILGANSTEAQRVALRHELGLDRPLLMQFISYVGAILQGDFGISYRLGRPVSAVFAERFPATFELAASGMLIAVVIGVITGVYTAINRRSIVSKMILGLSLFGISLPSFFMGVLLIWIFAVNLMWLPSFGRGETVNIGVWTTGFLTASGLRSLIMPALTIAVFQIAMIMRLVRAEMLEVLRSDYVRFARARGLPEWNINLRHALKNTLIPVITVIGLQFGSVVAFAVITEEVFQWPGLGLLFLQSVAAADVSMMSAYLIATAALFVAINFIVDILYIVIDPRLRSATAGKVA